MTANTLLWVTSCWFSVTLVCTLDASSLHGMSVSLRPSTPPLVLAWLNRAWMPAWKPVKSAAV